MLPTGNKGLWRRLEIATSVLLALACHGPNSGPQITISPRGVVKISGPQVFTATVLNTFDTVTWTLTGPGTLSGTTGYQVSYRPPAPIGAAPAMATVTASVAGGR
jgi:hypothetical protein